MIETPVNVDVLATILSMALSPFLVFDAPTWALDHGNLDYYDCRAWVRGPRMSDIVLSQTIIEFDEVFGPYRDVRCHAASPRLGHVTYGCIAAVNTAGEVSDCVASDPLE